MALRIAADFNSRTQAGWCWCLHHNNRWLNEVARELELVDGQQVVLYCDEPSDEFEFDAILSFQNGHWLALPDETTYRLISDGK